MDTGDDKCCHCSENEVTPCEGLQRIYCDECRWDLHYSRNWYYRDSTKAEFCIEQMRL